VLPMRHQAKTTRSTSIYTHYKVAVDVPSVHYTKETTVQCTVQYM
jgi:hypothetical protein